MRGTSFSLQSLGGGEIFSAFLSRQRRRALANTGETVSIEYRGIWWGACDC